MVDIFSKKDGPRREDQDARRLLQGNGATIRRLADQISNGAYSRSRAAMADAKKEPTPDGLNIHVYGGPSAPSEPNPVVRISTNERVFVMDANSGKQMEFLGQLCVKDGVKYFALATKENGFISPPPEEITDILSDLNNVVIDSDEIKEKLADVITRRLEL
ncbi:hypothetical protein [Ruegeria sp. EL01]|jgi:hypothetical protein|uniref:hypothetical protein n=1 Tax=Ruegeria sp. EL01 TaxID=2107578 RepID=UPI000EA81057|nr:hypothetical protein [Ruegeria sp. EL01]